MLIASLSSNTSYKHDDILSMTIPQIEDLFDGFEESSKETTGESKNTLQGADAMQFLVNQK